jgi:hypothetical protein
MPNAASRAQTASLMRTKSTSAPGGSNGVVVTEPPSLLHPAASRSAIHEILQLNDRVISGYLMFELRPRYCMTRRPCGA